MAQPEQAVAGFRCTAPARAVTDNETDFDGFGNKYEVCLAHDGGHLFLTQCGVTRCVHCQKVVAR